MGIDNVKKFDPVFIWIHYGGGHDGKDEESTGGKGKPMPHTYIPRVITQQSPT
jgi:hypothetical protein